MFWNKLQLPLTPNDQEWTEDSLLWLKEQFGERLLKTAAVKTPTTKYFNRKFKGTEEDVAFALDRICEYMAVDRASIYLSFYGQVDIAQSQGLPTGRTSDKTPSATFNQWPEGYKEIALHLKEIQDPIIVISMLAREVARIKLLSEGRLAKNNSPLTDLTAVAFGFGLFLGNSVFQMRQWQDSRLQGWSMKRRGALPEQVIGFAMAWMAAYQDDKDCTWSSHLNKTMHVYFQKCQKFIAKYPEKIRFEAPSSDTSLLQETAPQAPSHPTPRLSYDFATFEKEDSQEQVSLPDLNGEWTGELTYGENYRNIAGHKLSFQLHLKTKEEGEFEGVARDISGTGTNPSEASIHGFVEGSRISFVKQYSSTLEIQPDGNSKLMDGKPSREIHYSGIFHAGTQEFQGEWDFDAKNILRGFNREGTGKGTWRMKKIIG
jgi:hypothetical protein